jgi:fused signal recognition particle receptor
MFGSLAKLKQSLAKTKDNLLGKIAQVVTRRKIDDALLDEIEEILIEADVGVRATERLIAGVKEKARERRITDGDAVMDLLKEEITAIMGADDRELLPNGSIKPVIWLITGVNGVGKTTTIGKLATLFAQDGKKVMIGACDTFRAAAIDQVAIWAQRSGVEIIRSQESADPASVAFDAASAARARGVDILLIDTAGRLHTKSNLMEELKKIRRVVEKAAPQSTILSKLIIDGNTGQNALSQVKVFTDAVGCDGIIITKLDGTAKGGVVIAVAEELDVPVDFVGLGEGIEDIERFSPKRFAKPCLRDAYDRSHNGSPRADAGRHGVRSAGGDRFRRHRWFRGLFRAAYDGGGDNQRERRSGCQARHPVQAQQGHSAVGRLSPQRGQFRRPHQGFADRKFGAGDSRGRPAGAGRLAGRAVLRVRWSPTTQAADQGDAQCLRSGC